MNRLPLPDKVSREDDPKDITNGWRLPAEPLPRMECLPPKRAEAIIGDNYDGRKEKAIRDRYSSPSKGRGFLTTES